MKSSGVFGGLFAIPVLIAMSACADQEDSPAQAVDDEQVAAKLQEIEQLEELGDGALPNHAACGRAAPNLQNQVIADAALNGAANQRTGSSTGCPSPGVLQPTDDARYFCWTRGNDGATWTYLRNQRTGVLGWVRDDLLRGFGSGEPCPF